MNFWAVEHGKLVLYRRAGRCNQCGDCCRTHKITFRMEVGSSVQTHSNATCEYLEDDWSAREGWNMFLAQGIWWYFKIIKIEPKEIPSCCAALTKDNKCVDWGEEGFRPICHYWPFHPDHIKYFPRCGFSFEKEQLNE